ncbi:TonB-dependent receptor domain-containing protein [Dyella agri]|uniref:TonB-dependent receptor n=1 Tax=Dyella agri TaxID=1926869 RepID=A0ABW8KIG7_9GAMM
MASIKPIYAGLLLAALAAPVAVHAQVTHAFDLPAQALSSALRELGSQAQVNVIFDPAVIGARRAPALKGHYELKQALAKLLDGSGFKAEFTDASTVVIKPQPLPPGSSRSQPGKPVGKSAQAVQQPGTVTLKAVTVLGSLIPRSQIETASPLIVITSDDIKSRGFSSVADALQNASVNTGSVNNTAINTGDIWAAKTVSLFGLDPSYTKFLIDGRPMPVFSQVASGKNVDQLYTNLAGIPIDLVDRIEILPGGQSSLYGSDAIAGVVNIVLKKHVNVGTLDARIGWYSDGGGRERSVSASDSFSIGKLSLMLGAQVNDQQPMWAFQRSVTAQNFAGGINPQQASVNAVVNSILYGNSYFPAQPSDCNKLGGLWGGSEGYQVGSLGAFCGSTRSGGYSTLMNKSRSGTLSAHATYALTDSVQLYGDFFDVYQEQAHRVDDIYASVVGDANLMDDVVIIREFAPEEMANSLNGLLSQKNYENTYTVTLGGKVDFGSGWNLDTALTHSQENSNDRQIAMWGNNVPGSYGNTLLGPQLGTDWLGFPVYAPNYNLLTTPITPAQFASYLGAASIASSNRTDQLRTQLTQTSLFALPGGDAGLAVVAEQGYESWSYQPSPLLSSGQLLAASWNPSGGHRDRYAVATELNLPLLKMLTADLSARYDSYDAQGARFSHPTYSVGLEFRPVDSVLLRAKYSTSFKAPSLIDEFEGGSSGLGSVTDWVNCGRLGYTGGNILSCPYQYYSVPATVVETSNPDLQPLTARNFSYGVVWSPTAGLSVSLDYQHISIRNEVLKESSDYVMQTQLYCTNGTLDPQSPTCQAIDAQITRAPAAPGSPLLGQILQVVTKKINVAREVNNALNASLKYRTNPHAWGWLDFDLGYTRVLAHRQETFPGDPTIDYLRNPGFSTEFQTKANAALTWTFDQGKWSATLYGTYYGPTPNYIANLNDSYDVPHAGKVAPWRIYNASINYAPTRAWRLSLRVNNLRNSMPPIDVTYRSDVNEPFAAGNYNPYGREIFLEAQYQFGGGRR